MAVEAMESGSCRTICVGCFTETTGLGCCEHCGYCPGSNPDYVQALPPGTVLNGQYVLGKVLGKPGGFGITYLAWDNGLTTRVAIKEFMPHNLAGRDTNQLTVLPYSRGDQATFDYGLKSFVFEARILAQFSHPNIVRVRHFFEANGTAYFVMDYYEGMSLLEYLQSNNQPLSQNEALEIMLPILDGLAEVHAKGLIHRDIKPQNIYLTKSRHPVLLDFGSARYAIGERSNSLSVVVTPGFSPCEQYLRRGKQGPWTDIYAVSATLYYLVSGQFPADALEGNSNLVFTPAEQINKAFCDALRLGMAMRWENRPQTVREFRSILLDTKAEVVSDGKPDEHVVETTPSPKRFKTWCIPCGVSCLGVFLVLLFLFKGQSGASLEIWKHGDETWLVSLEAALLTSLYASLCHGMSRVGLRYSVGSVAGYYVPLYNLALLCICLIRKFENRKRFALSLTFSDGELKGNTIAIPGEGLIIGRNPRWANIILNYGEVSGTHVRIVPIGQKLVRVEDMHSTNGTFYRLEVGDSAEVWQQLTGSLVINCDQQVSVRLTEGGPTFVLEANDRHSGMPD